MITDFQWHSVAELPDHDGWIWVITGTRELGSKIRSYYYKKDGEHKHGYEQLRNIKLGINEARYWMWQIPLNRQLAEESIK